MCAKFQIIILNCRVVGTRQSSQIFRKNTWFLEKNRACSKFLYEILYYLISTIKLKQNQSIKKTTILYQPRKPPEIKGLFEDIFPVIASVTNKALSEFICNN